MGKMILSARAARVMTETELRTYCARHADKINVRVRIDDTQDGTQRHRWEDKALAAVTPEQREHFIRFWLKCGMLPHRVLSCGCGGEVVNEAEPHISQQAPAFAESLVDAVMQDLADKGTVWPQSAREDLILVLQISFTKGYQAGCRAAIPTGSAP